MLENIISGAIGGYLGNKIGDFFDKHKCKKYKKSFFDDRYDKILDELLEKYEKILFDKLKQNLGEKNFNSFEQIIEQQTKNMGDIQEVFEKHIEGLFEKELEKSGLKEKIESFLDKYIEEVCKFYDTGNVNCKSLISISDDILGFVKEKLDDIFENLGNISFNDLYSSLTLGYGMSGIEADEIIEINKNVGFIFFDKDLKSVLLAFINELLSKSLYLVKCEFEIKYKVSMPTQTIPNGRKKVKLGEVVEIKKKTFNPKSNEKFKYIGLEHIEQQSLSLNGYGYSNETTSMKTFFSKGDILFGKMRPYFRKVIRAPFDGVCSTEIFVLHSKDGIDNNFIFYYLANWDFIDKVTKSCGGVDRPRAKWEVIKEFDILLPPLPVQRKVASILSAYDELIENNNKRIKILEQMGKAIFDDMMKQAEEKGELEEVKLTDIIDFLEGPGLRRWQYKNKGIPILNIRVIENGEINLKKIDKYLDIEEVKNKYNHFLLNEYDHIISTSGTLGKFATIRKSHLPLCLNTSIIRFRPKNNKVGTWFIKHYLKNGEFKFKLEQMATGVAQKNFGPMHLKQINLKLPKEKLLNTFEKNVIPIELEILNLLDQNQNLKQTRDLLIPQLVSGRLDVEKMEIV